MEISAVPPETPAGLKYRSEAWNALHHVSLINFLDHDTRPLFILDLHHNQHIHGHPTIPIYINPALCKSHALFSVIGRTTLPQTAPNQFSPLQPFLTWAWSSERVSAHPHHFAAYTWDYITLEDRWRVVTATTSSPDDQQPADLLEGPPSTTDDTQRLPLAARDFFLDRSVEHDLSSAINSSAHPSTSSSAEAKSIPPPELTIDALRRDQDARTAKRNADLLTKIAAFDTVAIFFADIKGNIIFCNDAWYELCDHPRDQTNAMSWTKVIEDDELPRILDLWTRVIVHQEVIRYEARLKRRWVPPAAFPDAPTDFPVWFSACAYPDVSLDGQTIGVCGVMTDISEQKWTEHRMKQELSHAVERAGLMEQLSLRAKEVADTESRFRRLADMMPSAIWMSNEVGNVVYANDAYRDLVPGACDAENSEPWWVMIPDDHIPRAEGFYKQLMVDHIKVTFKIPFRKSPKNPDAPMDEYKWLLISAYPELNDDGRVKYITGCMTDITDLKLAEEIQAARISDALESTRQLERFIDMTSHEMRNPLSAIVHSAEEILSTLRGRDPPELAKTAVADAVEAAEIIIYCADHSTRIVDDILLVSKLESGLLTITPTIVHPVSAVKQALKMFDGEMRAADITHSFILDDSFDLLHVDWVNLDMSRVLQIFVNLITNAIKFTRPESVRHINIYMKVSLQRPNDADLENDVHYLESQTASTIASEGETVYISTTVEDTGCGLTEAEQKNLFLRFSQAGKRTHVKYGGTGLGLFISRQLCEMQGGQIGVRSTPNRGSTFSFYVMAQKAPPPELISPELSPTEGVPKSETTVEIGKSIKEDSAKLGHIKTPTAIPIRQLNNGVGDDEGLKKRPEPSSSSTVPPPANTLPGQNTDGSTRDNAQQTILLVEDNLINQKVVAKKVRSQGYTVLLANHGLEALDQISKSASWTGPTATATSISLILLDMEMPVMDGLTCIRRIRESEKLGEINCHIPVIAVTANARQEQINQAKGAGMDDVVTKPFRMDQLFAAIKRLIDQFPTTRWTKPQDTLSHSIRQGQT